MSTEQQPTPPPMPDQGLPPVEPPSAQLIVRLFLVPALIVAGLVLLFLAGPFLYNWITPAADSRSADHFLRGLDSSNPDVRYRAASDLAQVLLRKVELASNPTFALDLADRLDDALKRTADAEKELAKKFEGLTAGQKAVEVKALEADRNLITYLIGALGNCLVPAGAPLLQQVAVQSSGMESVALAERRGRALFALATLGEGLRRFADLPAEAREKVLAELREEEERPDRATRAAAMRAYLQARSEGKPASLGVPDTLEKCAQDDDPFLRELAAFAAGFWAGPAVEEAKVESFLVTLAVDDGRGEELLEERREKAGNPAATREVTTIKGFTVQANAVASLARRGSAKTPLDRLAMLLSPEELRAVFVLRDRAGKDTPNEALVVHTLLSALKATAKFVKQRPEARAKLEPLVKALAADRNAAVSAEAREALHAFQGPG